MEKLSVFIITFNCARTLGACLESVKWADEIVMLDSASTDGTLDLAEKYGCNLAQLVIAWTVEQPGITFALCGARKPEHSKQNAVGGTLILEVNDIEKMRIDVEALGTPI